MTDQQLAPVLGRHHQPQNRRMLGKELGNAVI